MPWTCPVTCPPRGLLLPDKVMDPHAVAQNSKTKLKQHHNRKRAHGHGKQAPTSADHGSRTATPQPSDTGSDCHPPEHENDGDVDTSDGSSPADFGALLHDASCLVGTSHIRHNTLMAVLTEKLPVTAIHHSETVRYISCGILDPGQALPVLRIVCQFRTLVAACGTTLLKRVLSSAGGGRPCCKVTKYFDCACRWYGWTLSGWGKPWTSCRCTNSSV